MDLYSDFHDTKWDNKGQAPESMKDLDGYQTYSIIRTSKQEKDGEPIFRYYLSSEAGYPAQAFIYGSYRDPLKGIGHCGIKITDKNYCKLITGCIVEDDWVEMKQEYFDALDVQGEAPKEEKAPRLSLILGLAGDVNADKWNKKGQPPKNKSNLGYHYVTVLRCTAKDDGSFSYIVGDDEGRPMEVILCGAARDPLRSIGNCFLKVVKEGDKSHIKGIIVEDDWVEMI